MYIKTAMSCHGVKNKTADHRSWFYVLLLTCHMLMTHATYRVGANGDLIAEHFCNLVQGRGNVGLIGDRQPQHH